MQCAGAIPELVNKLVGEPVCSFVEESQVDPRNKVFRMRSTNHSFTSLLQVVETCTYRPHPENAEHTQLVQEVQIKAFPYGMRSRIEDTCHAKFTANASRGLQVMDKVCDRLRREAEEVTGMAQVHTRQAVQGLKDLAQETTGVIRERRLSV